MTGRELAAAMRRRTRADVKFASMTWEERKKAMARGRRERLVLQACFTIGGLACGIGSLTEIVLLVGFGILGPLALRYDLL
jgi:hypothetical protein